MPYSCKQCVRGQPCQPCKTRRAERSKLRRAHYRAAERCIQCGAEAEPGLTRCAHHAALNAQHSGASHARAITSAD